MPGRIVEIAEDGRHLMAHRGFMVIKTGGEELGRVALDDIDAVIANAHGLTYSNNLLVALAERGAGLVLCAANHRPAAWLWPADGHHAQSARIAAQLDATRPLAKRLWQIVVRAKIAQQAAVLRALGQPDGGFGLLTRKVRSGDPENVEAQAARRYWPLVMGADFRRDPKSGGVNGLLNYAYTVLRAGTARAVIAAGLHPSLGIHHHGPTNPMCLVDDLMEPFRPVADLLVARLAAEGVGEVTSEAKREMAGLLILDMATAQGTTPVGTCLQRLATSLAAAYETGEVKLDLPAEPLPLDLARSPAHAGTG